MRAAFGRDPFATLSESVCSARAPASSHRRERNDDQMLVLYILTYAWWVDIEREHGGERAVKGYTTRTVDKKRKYRDTRRRFVMGPNYKLRKVRTTKKEMSTKVTAVNNFKGPPTRAWSSKEKAAARSGGKRNQAPENRAVRCQSPDAREEGIMRSKCGPSIDPTKPQSRVMITISRQLVRQAMAAQVSQRS